MIDDSFCCEFQLTDPLPIAFQICLFPLKAIKIRLQKYYTCTNILYCTQTQSTHIQDRQIPEHVVRKPAKRIATNMICKIFIGAQVVWFNYRNWNGYSNLEQAVTASFVTHQVSSRFITRLFINNNMWPEIPPRGQSTALDTICTGHHSYNVLRTTNLHWLHGIFSGSFTVSPVSKSEIPQIFFLSQTMLVYWSLIAITTDSLLYKNICNIYSE